MPLIGFDPFQPSQYLTAEVWMETTFVAECTAESQCGGWAHDVVLLDLVGAVPTEMARMNHP